MKTLTTLAVLIIGVLTLAAFNPKDVVRTYQKAKHRFVTEPRRIAQLEELLEKADAGDPDAAYRIGSMHATMKYRLFEWQQEVIGDRDAEIGERMIRESAAKGQPDAKYWVWREDGGSLQELLHLIEIGSSRARIHVMGKFYRDPCETKWDPHMQVIREHMSDPTSPVYAYLENPEAHVDEMSTRLDEEVRKYKAHRVTACTAGHPAG